MRFGAIRREPRSLSVICCEYYLVNVSFSLYAVILRPLMPPRFEGMGWDFLKPFDSHALFYHARTALRGTPSLSKEALND